MPIFARKKEEVPELPEKVPEIPTAEELKKIAQKLLEHLKIAEKVPSELASEPEKITEAREERPAIETKITPPATQPEISRPEVERKEKPAEEAVPTPPLFIKLERYHRLLRHLSELRRTLTTTKLTISTLTEIEKMREENLKLLQKAIENMDKKLAALDAELLRPRLPETPEIAGTIDVEGAVGDLRAQLQSLREELESMI